MRRISQRELRNDNAAVVRAVQEGEQFLVTRRGVPVALLGPPQDAGLPLVRPSVARPVFADLPRVASAERTADLLTSQRGER